MNATVTSLRLQAAKPLERGFPSLPCVLCGNADGNVTVSLDDVSQFNCKECGGDFDAPTVRGHIALWQRVLAWIDTAPATNE